MILRISEPTVTGHVTSGWDSFAHSQKVGAGASAYVSQPAHARLAGTLAASLLPQAFGHLQEEVIEAIQQHDTGWSAPDLAALEMRPGDAPASFLDVPSPRATAAWRRSIREAEQRSSLQAVLISRHFCLLSPVDGDPAHELFTREEIERREPIERACGIEKQELDRYTAALGFCDLVSLLMCSGIAGEFELPIAHPAHPQAGNAPRTVCRLRHGAVGFDRPMLTAGMPLSVRIWTRTSSGSIGNDRCEWKAE
jgi:uncharacterized protein DUF3891